jgi:hypothetical protein
MANQDRTIKSSLVTDLLSTFDPNQLVALHTVLAFADGPSELRAALKVQEQPITKAERAHGFALTGQTIRLFAK